MSDLNGPGIEAQTSRTDSDVLNNLANRSIGNSFEIKLSLKTKKDPGFDFQKMNNHKRTVDSTNVERQE